MNKLKARLALLMFCHFMSWGAWYPVLPTHLAELGLNGTQIGVVYSMLPLCCFACPLVFSQLADRTFGAEKLLAVLYLSSGASLCLMAGLRSYHSIVLAMTIWSITFAPTFPISNALVLRHSKPHEFPIIRVFGTVGWIAAGMLLSVARTVGLASSSHFWRLTGADSLWMGGILSLVLGTSCFLLPRTPPVREPSSNRLAIVGALRLIKDPSFAVFIGVTLIVSTEVMFYYVLTSPFLKSIGIPEQSIPATMTLAQAGEALAMLALPTMLKSFGLRQTLLIGMVFWPIRYALFSYGHPTWLIVASLSLHGLCFVCFTIVGFIYVDQVSPSDIRASAQALVIIVSQGIGWFLGSIFAGWTQEHFTREFGGAQVVDYSKVFLVPCVVTAVCSIIFLAGFRLVKKETPNIP